MSDYDGYGAIRDLSSEIAQLRAELATVTAALASAEFLLNGKNLYHRYTTERAAHAETRKALERERISHGATIDQRDAAERDLESTRAALARSEARVQELRRECDSWRQGCTARTDDR